MAVKIIKYLFTNTCHSMMNEYHLFQWIAFGAHGPDFLIVVKPVTEEARQELDKKL